MGKARENIIAAVFPVGASVGCLAVLLGIYFVFVVVVVLKLITLGKPEKCFLTFVPTTNVTEQHLRR